MRIHPAFWILLFVSGSLAHARTYIVKNDGTGDFPNIQAAINAVAAGDTVALVDGVFTGDGNRDITFLGKGVVLRSAGGNPANCVIDAQGTHGHKCLRFESGEGPQTVVEALTLRGGYTDLGAPGGGGVYCTGNSAPTIRDCILTGNHAYTGGGMGIDAGSHPTVVNCLFLGNTSSDYGAGLNAAAASTIAVTAAACSSAAPS